MLRVRILVGTANNTPTWSDAQASTSYCSVCQEEGVDGGGGQSGRPKHSGVPFSEPHSCEDVNASGSSRVLNCLCHIATVGISDSTPRAV